MLLLWTVRLFDRWWLERWRTQHGTQQPQLVPIICRRFGINDGVVIEQDGQLTAQKQKKKHHQ